MEEESYYSQIEIPFQDKDTYEKKYLGFTCEETKTFNWKARKIIERSQRGKKLKHLLEEASRPPSMTGSAVLG